MPEDQSPAVITMRKSSRSPLARVVRTSEKHYPNGRIVAGDHKSGHETTTPSRELMGLLSAREVDIMTTNLVGRQKERLEMADLISAPDEMPDAVAALEPVTDEVTQAPVLITEQEVLFSTAPALRVRPAKTRRGLIAVLRPMFVKSTPGAEKPRRHYPPRHYSYLKHAAMAREMHRL